MRSSPATTSAGRPPTAGVSSSEAIRNGRSDDDANARCGARGGLAREARDVVVLGSLVKGAGLSIIGGMQSDRTRARPALEDRCASGVTPTRRPEAARPGASRGRTEKR